MKPKLKTICIALSLLCGVAHSATYPAWGADSNYLDKVKSFDRSAKRLDLSKRMVSRTAQVGGVFVGEVDKKEWRLLTKKLVRIKSAHPMTPIVFDVSAKNNRDKKVLNWKKSYIRRNQDRFVYAVNPKSSRALKTQYSKIVKANGQDITVSTFNYRADRRLDLYHPKKFNGKTFVYFHAGGWSGGSFRQSIFRNIVAHFARNGYQSVIVEYAVSKRQIDATPFDSLADAKSAVRWVKSRLNTDRLIICGSSAGGHLSLAMLYSNPEKYNHPEDDLSIDTIPDEIWAYFPVLDNGPNGYGSDRVGEEYPDFSPLHWLRDSGDPRITNASTRVILHASPNDEVASIHPVREFNAINGNSRLVEYPGRTHLQCPSPIFYR